MVSVRVPGKIVLLGEYAVLEGSWAIAAAVDRFAKVTLRPGARVGGDNAELERIAADLITNSLGPWSVTLDSRAFFHDGVKLGLGASAALMVGVHLAIMLARKESPAPDVLWSRAQESHCKLQGGQGSGVDIAACVLGGTLAFRRQGATMEHERLALPKGYWDFIWSGVGSATPKFLHAFAEVRLHPRVALLLGEMRAVAEAGREACVAAKSTDFGTILEHYGALVERLGHEMRHVTLTPEHVAIATVVRKLGGRYKPCGAGGGDFGVALYDAPEPREAARAALRAAGFLAGEVQIEERGAMEVSDE